MITSEQIALVKEYISSAQSILVFLPPQPSFDVCASTVAFVSGIESLGKSVSLLSLDAMPSETSQIIGIQTVSSKLGNKDLQVSFSYSADQVEKVSYNIDEENKRFNLVIQPKKGVSPLDSSTLQCAYTGADADDEFTEVFHNIPIISVAAFEPEWATIKLDSSGVASQSEAVTSLLNGLGAHISADTATNLLSGIEKTTDSFRSLTTTAETFDCVSQLLKAGGRRIMRSPSSLQKKNSFAEAIASTRQENVNVGAVVQLPGGRHLPKAKTKQKALPATTQNYQQREASTLL